MKNEHLLWAWLIDNWKVQYPINQTAEAGRCYSAYLAADALLEQLRAALRAGRPETPPEPWTALDGSLTIRFLQFINAKRAIRWHQNGGIKSWSALEWAGAMAGEAGEACNAAKKLKRIEDQIANINLEEGRSLTDTQNASAQVVDEIADTVIYGVLLAERVGLDLEEAIRMKFNKKSEEYGFPERIPPNQAPAEPADHERPRELLDRVMTALSKEQDYYGFNRGAFQDGFSAARGVVAMVLAGTSADHERLRAPLGKLQGDARSHHEAQRVMGIVDDLCPTIDADLGTRTAIFGHVREALYLAFEEGKSVRSGTSAASQEPSK